MAEPGERPVLSPDVVERFVRPLPGRRQGAGIPGPDRLPEARPVDGDPGHADPTVLGRGGVRGLDPAFGDALLAERHLQRLVPAPDRREASRAAGRRRRHRGLAQPPREGAARAPAQAEGPSGRRARSTQKVFTADEGNAALRRLPQCFQSRLSAFVFNFIDVLTHGRSESEILLEIAPTRRPSPVLHALLVPALSALRIAAAGRPAGSASS